MSERTGVSRRDFLALAGAGMGALAVGGLSGCAAGGSSAETASTAEAAEAAVDWLGTAPQIADADIVDTKETDLLIIGAGNAGMSAAATAADLGIDFMVCEKNAGVQESRHWVGGVNTKWQQQAGITVDEGKLLNELTRYASGRCNQRVWKVWIDESADTIDFIDGIMSAAGMGIYLDTEDYGHPTGGTDYYVPPQQHMWYDPADAQGMPPCLWGEVTKKQRNMVLEEYIQGKGHQVEYKHSLVELVREQGGRVSSAIFDTADGYVRINAKKGVLLATGGYPANTDMVSALSPDSVETCTGAFYMPGNTGDGIRAGLWVGAKMDTVSAPMIFDRGGVAPGVDAGYADKDGKKVFPAPLPQFMAGSEPFMKVSRDGRRFFNESAPYDWCANAAGDQPGGVWCSLFDANAAADTIRFQVVGCAKIGTALFSLGKPEEAYKDGVEAGVLMQADTLEELADKLGFTGDAKKNLLAEVERYNGFYDAGVDEDFGKEAFRLSALRQPPYYGFWCGGSLLTTLDGLQIDENMRVLDTEHKVIDGLYAAGDTSGCLFSGNYPEYLVGCACGRTITEGRHAVRYIAGDIR